jgi:polysaccharide biosynthesis/export protein
MNSQSKFFRSLLIAAMALPLAAVGQQQPAASPLAPQQPSAPAMVAPVTTPPTATVPAQAAGQPTSTNAAKAATPSAAEMLIGDGDLLEVSVFGAPDFEKREVRVSDQGDIALPFIGVQHVGGLNAAQAEALIADKLAAGQFFNNPQVSVFVKDYASQGVSVLGEVQKPGVYQLLGTHRLYDAISIAGGLSPKAGKLVTITHRNDPDKPEKITLQNDLQASAAGNTKVLPGDTIVVSKAGIVYVVGDVKLPGGFLMEQGNITVLQALALAQGANPTASLNSSRLIRKVNGEQQDLPIQLKDILSAKAPDMNLRADDILFVPNSAAKSGARRGLEAILQTATGIAIYHPY